MATEKKGTILMNKYELGSLLGQGTFAKVYHGRSLSSGQSVAIKIISKDKVSRKVLMEQIKREISVMRLMKHPNIVSLHEVMASKRKIYFAMEFAKGGELFDKVAKQGRLREDLARKYFQQLIGAVDYCHSRGVYHRDLKPENLLLDENGDLKVSDFGLSALWDSRRQDGLLHTTCGTPAYVAPEVIHRRGYDGAKADIWSCGVILFVLLAGYLPFNEQNLMDLYKKIFKGKFRCPQWFPLEVRKLLSKILDPNPSKRISIDKIMENRWVRNEFQYVEQAQLPCTYVDKTSKGDVDSSFSMISEITEKNAGREEIKEASPTSPMIKTAYFNAFDIISLSPGFDLSGLFEKDNRIPRSPGRFISNKPASEIVSKFEEIAETEKFKLERKDGTVKLQGRREGRKGQLGIDAYIFEMTPSFHVVELSKTAGDTLEFREFCDHGLKPSLKDIVWTWQGCDS
ncbi:hypothetical protein TIFTF001_012742 [Ficus carica]|uniref:non-specific serine/threonine protein kinase n=1 Tax=Ficus carica TaxID=3494 RepID=A0AA88A0K0_FICCA|nr:hypothetical protein TIFTF001_012742 [Ficus carica]